MLATLPHAPLTWHSTAQVFDTFISFTKHPLALHRYTFLSDRLFSVNSGRVRRRGWRCSRAHACLRCTVDHTWVQPLQQAACLRQVQKSIDQEKEQQISASSDVASDDLEAVTSVLQRTLEADIAALKVRRRATR